MYYHTAPDRNAPDPGPEKLPYWVYVLFGLFLGVVGTGVLVAIRAYHRA